MKTITSVVGWIMFIIFIVLILCETHPLGGLTKTKEKNLVAGQLITYSIKSSGQRPCMGHNYVDPSDILIVDKHSSLSGPCNQFSNLYFKLCRLLGLPKTKKVSGNRLSPTVEFHVEEKERGGCNSWGLRLQVRRYDICNGSDGWRKRKSRKRGGRKTLSPKNFFKILMGKILKLVHNQTNILFFRIKRTR